MTPLSHSLIALLGQPFDHKHVRDLLRPLDVKRVASADSPLSESIVWIPKASLRLDVYRSQPLNKLTGSNFSDPGWIVGAVRFLAPGSDTRIKAPFPAPLPHGLTMASSPQACVDAYGAPDLDEEHERPGFSGRVLAWRRPTTNIAITFAGLGRDSAMIDHTVCLIGCIGAWRYSNPEVFAP
ncbi:hypothetical protein J5226_17425 [Lysobacter sp. K5869]|uniref:hypothetical protein n=1 Tax=Lysobacter sp. K5869 TaxID=2820808 RepID=UPI001C0625C9|nr:hypothetical protein [Lysobacter sp. K5869]QWP75391.1 hypothetical protein J5226_17425 [Lysobacter sp. K5869]